MPFLVESIIKFIVLQLLQALITVQMVKDVVLDALKFISVRTKSTLDDRIYKKVKFYFNEDPSEHIQLDADQTPTILQSVESEVVKPESENK